MARITSIWLTISDDAGSSCREVFKVDIGNVVGVIKVEGIAFYQQGEDRINRLLESKYQNPEDNVAVQA